MRLLGITLRNFRGVEESSVDFSEGVTVVQGPNEIGKSSIVEALRLIRDEKDSAKKACVRTVQPVGSDVGPEVEIRLRIGGYDMKYRKRWLRSTLTELAIFSPKAEQLSGDQAHARFKEILVNCVDVELLEALDVAQGNSLDQPELARINALHRALDSTAEASSEQDALSAAIDQEYAKYFTRTGKPTGRLREVEAQLTQLAPRLAGLQTRSAEMDGFVQEHAQRVEQRTALGTEVCDAQRSLADAQEADAQVSTLRQAAEVAQQNNNEAARRTVEAKASIAVRAQQITQVGKRSEECERLSGVATDLESVLTQAMNRCAAAEQGAATLDAQRRAAHSETIRARAALDLSVARADHDRLLHQVEQAHASEDARLKALAALNSSPIDDGAIAKLDELSTELLVARRAREAAAAQLRVRALGGPEVTVDGRPVPAGSEHDASVLTPIRIEAAGVLEVDVTPGTPPAELAANVSRAEKALDRALARHSVDSVDQARVIADHRREASTALERAEASLEALLQGEELTDLDERLATLSARIQQAASSSDDSGVEAASTSDGGVEASTPASLQQAADAARDAEEGLVAQLDQANTEVERLRSAVAEAQEKSTRTSAQLESAGRELDRASQELDRARSAQDDDALQRAWQAASDEAALAEQALEAAEAAVNGANPETVAMRLANAQDLVATKTKAARTVDQRIVELTALIDDRAGDGIYDELAGAQAALEAATTEHERLERSAQAIALLQETMERHRSEMQQRYVAPFREHMERLGRVVFGSSFQVEISPELVVESRTLDGRTVPFGSLSAGAREQIALLGRLASAQLIDADEGAPVILDDSLGFADPIRLDQLNVVLNDVGHSAQVIILTCQPGRFGSIGGAKVVDLATTSGPTAADI